MSKEKRQPSAPIQKGLKPRKVAKCSADDLLNQRTPRQKTPRQFEPVDRT